MLKESDIHAQFSSTNDIPMRPLNLDLWPCALWVVKSQFALHRGSEFQWSVFHTGRALLCFSHTLTYGKHRTNSEAFLAPCLPPGPPLALFTKARPLSAALSAPSLYSADYPHPESILPFLLPFPLCSSFCTPPQPPQGVLTSPVLRPPSPAHGKSCASIFMNETAARRFKQVHLFSIFT